MKTLRNMIMLVMLVLSMGCMCQASELSNGEVITKTVKDTKSYMKSHGLKIYKKWNAHRGCSAFAPENTMPAFRIAAKLGAYQIETDVRMTKDGVLVCFHDSSIVRTLWGTGTIGTLTYEDLQALEIRQPTPFKGLLYSATKIHVPKFSSYLDLFDSYKHPIARIELKRVPKSQDVDVYTKAIYDEIVAHDMQDRCFVFSHYYKELESFGKWSKKYAKKNGIIKIWMYGDDEDEIKMLHKKYNTSIYPKNIPYTGVFSDSPVVVKNNKKYNLLIKPSGSKYKFYLEQR